MTYGWRHTKGDWKPTQRDRQTRPTVHQNRKRRDDDNAVGLNGIGLFVRYAMSDATRRDILFFTKLKCQLNWIRKSIKILPVLWHEPFVVSLTSIYVDNDDDDDIDGGTRNLPCLVTVEEWLQQATGAATVTAAATAVLSPSKSSFANHSRCSLSFIWCCCAWSSLWTLASNS